MYLWKIGIIKGKAYEQEHVYTNEKHRVAIKIN